MFLGNMHRALHFVIVMLLGNMYRALHFVMVMLLCNQYWVQDLLIGLFPLLLGQFLQLLAGVKLSMEFLLLRILAMVFLVSMLNMYQPQIFLVLPTLGLMSRFLCYVVVIRSISNFLRYVMNDINSFRNTIMDYLYISCMLQHSEFLAAAHGLVVLWLDRELLVHLPMVGFKDKVFAVGLQAARLDMELLVHAMLMPVRCRPAWIGRR